jgi:lipase chaperone LimK
MNFNMKLDRVLREAPTPTPGAALGATASGTAPAAQQTGAQQTNTQQNKGAQQKADQDKQQQNQQGTQLATRMADLDKQIAQLQAKIQGGAAKPAEIGKLNQLLTAKKSVQDQYMRLQGVNPSA